MADRTNPAIRNIYFNSGASARHAGAFYKPVAAEDRTDFQPVTPVVPQTPESLQLDPRIEDVPEEERLNA